MIKKVSDKINSARLIRRTKSMCPVCMKELDASVVEKQKKVWLIKTCQEHGHYEVLLSANAFYYCQLENFYFAVMKGNPGALLEYEIWPTLRCNMECSTCCFGTTRTALEAREASCREIEHFITKHKSPFYTLSGGEPTCRSDLVQIIAMLKKHKRTVTVNTNGLKFIDVKYLNQLKEAGVDRVNVQFDGFSRQTYRILRGDDLLDEKLKIMNNLKAVNMQTTINAVIAKAVNEAEIIRLIDYSVKNKFINGLTFFTICYVGEVRDWPLERLIMPDEVIDIVEKQTQGKISRHSVFLFQKLHLAIKSYFGQKYCLYNQIYLLVRYGHSYEPIDSFLNLSMSEVWVDRYRRWMHRRWIATACLVLGVLSLLMHSRSFFIIKEIFTMGISYFFKTSWYLKNKRFLSISFSTGCDPYKLDYDILRNCKNGVITVDKKSGRLRCFEQGCTYNVDLERDCRRFKQAKQDAAEMVFE